MKLLEKDQNVVATPVVARPVETPNTGTTGATKPSVAVRARVATRPSRRESALAGFCRKTAAFGSIVGAVYVVSTLMGYVTLERARQGARHGAERAVYARAEAKAAREGIEVLTNPTTLHAWADAHGFVAGTVAAQPKATGTVVAHR